MRSSKKIDSPLAVLQARQIEWGVFIDAILVDAAQVGDRYAAMVYDDQSGRAEDGSTVVTPPLRWVRSQGIFKMFRSACGTDHYVIASEHPCPRRSVDRDDRGG